MDQAQVPELKPEARVQRAILRTVQTDSGIERSALGLQTRPYDQDGWGVALEDLVKRGILVESSVVRVRHTQKRAVIVYALESVELPGKAFEYPNFKDMSAEEVQSYLDQYWPLPSDQ